MAKQRKSKNEDTAKPESTEAVVRHQKLCLSIDMENRRIYGHTELEVAVPDIGFFGLHAACLEIESVFVDGEPAEYEYYPHQFVENDQRWGPISSTSSAADVASSAYLSALEREMGTNLLINCCKGFRIESEQQDQLISENGLQSSAETKQNVKLVRINYWVEKAETGIHFKDNTLYTDNQMRRSRCWFPCIDDSSHRCSYDLEFTVAQNLVAVSSGNLLCQVLSKDDPPRKTYVYKVTVPVAACWISLAVAPFEILPDHHGLISHMCLPPNLSKLQNTVEFFHSAFRHYEEYLSQTFPFGSYKQVFIAPEMAVSSLTLGASVSIISSQVLFDEKIIDQIIDTRIKLAYALARQWFGVYITPETSNDEWLVEGLSGFLTDTFIKQFLGNNEARYRRYKANCAVCKADDCGATALSSPASCKDMYGTQCIGLYGKIRSWKSVAILQMLEKQMGPDSFRKILQTIVSRARDLARSFRSLSTKEFRHLANKVGNLERPFLKEFFPRWVESCGCPVLRMGLSYNKRKNMVELAVLRGCTAALESCASVPNIHPDSENRDGDIGWPGMMSIRVHELDGMHDHPILPMAGESWQLLEIQCHSKLAAKRFQKPKKGSKADGSDENSDIAPAIDMRSSMESPLLWIRADPEMEYLAEIHFNQPVQMWINQLEKDRDVIAQSQAIGTLEAFPLLSFNVVNALNNFLNDSKAFWRVRIEAAFALAKTTSEETDWAGLTHLVKFFRNQRFDADIGLPKPNDFRDFPEYFVLEAIPQAVAMVRAADNRSPREAVEFISQLLKYNDNNGNLYSDVFWLAALVQSVGELEFGQQNILFLSSLLKRIDRLLQFDRLMPSHNGILTISCIRTLTQVALKLSEFVPLDRVSELIKPFLDLKTMWQVRIEARKSLLDFEFHSKGIDAGLLLFMKYLEEELSLRGQVKLSVHAMRLCQLQGGSDSTDAVDSSTLVALLHLLEGRMSFNNVYLRHYLFCILQVLAGRSPTLYGVPRDKIRHINDAETRFEQRNIFAVLEMETKPAELPVEPVTETKVSEHPEDTVNILSNTSVVPEAPKPPEDTANLQHSTSIIPEVSKEVDNVSVSHERKMPVVKIRVKPSATTSRAEDTDNKTVERSHGGRTEADRGASSSVSVDAPQRNISETVSISNHNHEEANSYHDRGSRMTASIGSAKVAGDGDELGKELQCTADSSKVSAHLQSGNPSSPNFDQDNDVDDAQKFVSLQNISVGRHDFDFNSNMDSQMHGKEKGKERKKDKEKKRKRDDHKGHRDDPEYLERKRLKKEKKQKEKEKKHKEKEITKLLNDQVKSTPAELMQRKNNDSVVKRATVQVKSSEPSGSKMVIKTVDTRAEVPAAAAAAAPAPTPTPTPTPAPKIRIKIKSRTLEK